MTREIFDKVFGIIKLESIGELPYIVDCVLTCPAVLIEHLPVWKTDGQTDRQAIAYIGLWKHALYASFDNETTNKTKKINKHKIRRKVQKKHKYNTVNSCRCIVIT